MNHNQRPVLVCQSIQGQRVTPDAAVGNCERCRALIQIVDYEREGSPNRAMLVCSTCALVIARGKE